MGRKRSRAGGQPVDAGPLLARARDALAAYDYPKARALHEEAFRTSHGALSAAKELVGLLVNELGLDDDALALREQLDAQARDDETIRRMLGLAAARVGAERTARELLAGVRQPEAAPAWVELGRRRLAAGDLEAVPGCIVEIRELDPAHPGARELERGIEEARARVRAPEEQALEAMVGRSPPAEVARAASALLARFPDSSVAARVLRDAQGRERADRAVLALERARTFEAAGELGFAVDAYREAVALGADAAEALARCQRAFEQARHRREVEEIAAALGAGDDEDALLRYWRSADSVRRAVREHVHREDLALLEELGRPDRAASETIQQLMLLLAARERVQAGDLGGAGALLDRAPRVSALTLWRELRREVDSILDAQARREAANHLAAVQAHICAGDVEQAEALARAIDVASLDPRERDRHRELQGELEDLRARARLRQEEESAARAGDWLAARRAAEALAAAGDESAASRAGVHDAALARSHALEVVDSPVPIPIDARALPELAEVWLSPDRTRVVWPSQAGPWVFLRFHDATSGRCSSAVRLRFRGRRGLADVVHTEDELILCSYDGEALALTLDGSHVRDAYQPALGRVDDVTLAGGGRYLWALARDGDRVQVVDRLQRREVRAFGETHSVFVARGSEGREVVCRAMRGRGVTVHVPSGKRATFGDVRTMGDWPPTSGVVVGEGLLLLETEEEALTVLAVDARGSVRGRARLEDLQGEGVSGIFPRSGGAFLLYTDAEGHRRLAELDAAPDGALRVGRDEGFDASTVFATDAGASRIVGLRWEGSRLEVSDPERYWGTRSQAADRDLFVWPTSDWLYDWMGAPETRALAAELRRLPAARRNARVERELAERPAAPRVLYAVHALRDVGDFAAASALLRERAENEPSDELLACELALDFRYGDVAAAREALEPHAGAIARSPYADRVAMVLAQLRFRTTDIEGAVSALRAGIEAGGANAGSLAEALNLIEQIYGEEEPRAPGIREARRLVRAMCDADVSWRDGDPRAAIERLEAVMSGRRPVLGVLARLAEAWLAVEPADAVESFRKLEVIASLTDRLAIGYDGEPLPAPADRMTPSHLSALRARCEAWLDEVAGTVREPEWAGELDEVLGVDTAAADARLVWKLGREDEAWRLLPYVQRALAPRGYTPGRRVRGDDDVQSVATTPVDRAALRLVAAPAESEVERLAELLELLAESPLLLLGTRALEVRTRRATLVVRQARGALTVRVRVGGEESSPAELLERVGGARCLVEVDEAAALATIVRFGAVHLRVLRALSHESETDRRAIERRLARLGELFELSLDESLQGAEIAADERLVLAMRWLEGWLRVEAFVRPVTGGPAYVPGSGPARVVGVVDGSVVHSQRDLVREQAVARALCEELSLDPSGDTRRWSLAGREAALALVARVARSPERYVIEWQGAPLELAPPLHASALSIKLAGNGERWLSVDGALAVDEVLVGLGELLAAIRGKRRFVRIEGGRFAELEERLRRWVEELDAVAVERDGRLTIGPAAAALFRTFEGRVDGDAWTRLADRIAAARDDALDDEVLPGLRPYQRAGVLWMARSAAQGLGGCLADDMGLGKTRQALALLAHRAGRGPALVVAPTSVLHQWMEEAARHAPELRVRLHHGGARSPLADALAGADVLLTSYGVVVQDRDSLSQVRFATLVLDEAQSIKNPRSRRAGAVRALDAEVAFALTGTPIENHLGELWSLFSVIEPTLFGSWTQFRRRFATPIERGGDEAARALLGRVIAPFVLRRTKSDVLPDLPPRTTKTVWVERSAEERAVYEAARSAAIDAVSDAADQLEILAALTRLRQLACDVRLVDPTAMVASSKLRTLVALVSELRDAGHRVLIFSQFVRLLELAERALEDASVRCTMLTGATAASERSEMGAQLAAGAADALLISLKAGGVGLNLTAASYVIHLDPWWNPAVEDQASDRAHRIGQTQPVTVVRLVSRGTIEEAVLALHDGKRALYEAVLTGMDAASRLSAEELASLLRHR